MALSANEHLVSATMVIPVTPGTTNLPDHKGIWVGGAGTINVTLLNGQTATISGINAGTLLPLRVRQINVGGTATLMLLWV